MTYVLANAGFNVSNTFADSEGFADFLKQHAEALHIRQSNQQAIGNKDQPNTDAFDIVDSCQHVRQNGVHMRGLTSSQEQDTLPQQQIGRVPQHLAWQQRWLDQHQSLPQR